MRIASLMTAAFLALTAAAPIAITFDATPAAAQQAAQIDINTAKKSDLEALHGIGPARADAIIKGRPYKAKDELHEKNIISKSVYDGIKDKIIAKRS